MAKEGSLIILLMKRFSADLDRPLARVLGSAEMFAQKGENLLSNSFSGSQSRYGEH
jgi:hypothetical protein